MKKGLTVVLVIFCVIAFCTIPAAASANDAEKKTVDVVVSPFYDPIPETKASLTGTITQGETKVYSYPMPAGKTTLKVRLSWSSTTNNLGLTIISPPGVTHGEFDDYYESSTANGIIPVQFDSNNVPSGDWTFYINGKSVNGSQSFTITATYS